MPCRPRIVMSQSFPRWGGTGKLPSSPPEPPNGAGLSLLRAVLVVTCHNTSCRVSGVVTVLRRAEVDGNAHGCS